ncbi:endoplasmic reticulum-Golgi intermediate compartment protein 3-like [Actinia tenebrosa]|uniref:Endoplasmic reticulum-Golgi intermediate compartment protein 3 n=1 Tax=Actinia tenebrosa TaxID=6105 RepID=A0A6P8HKM6_ACTTE|nr:endoplasmic reticulum-Golgi intermediate compartment protein 3-like [Actinia tenebrosa]
MQSKDLFTTLKRFDAYPKTLEDFRIKTFGGAAVTFISGVLMFLLFVSELNYYLTTEVTPELFVDTTRGQKLKINVDISFSKLPCVYLSIDAMDVSGEQQIDVASHMLKKRLDLDGKPIDEKAEKEDLGDKSHQAKELLELDPNRCESCYGAETPDSKCCNTCEEVRDAYRRKGWALSSIDDVKQSPLTAAYISLITHFNVIISKQVAGNFHFAPGKSFQQHHIHVSILKLKSGGNVISMNLHDLQPFGETKFNLTHRINHLSFGHDYPGKEYPLDNTLVPAEESGSMYQYFVKIVPTTYRKLGGEILHTHQFSVTKHRRTVRQRTGEHGLPDSPHASVFCHQASQDSQTENRRTWPPSYHLLDIDHHRFADFTFYRNHNINRFSPHCFRSFMHFLTGVCAIIGGIFTVAGLVDSMIYHSSRAIQKKIDLGKAN